MNSRRQDRLSEAREVVPLMPRTRHWPRSKTAQVS